LEGRQRFAFIDELCAGSVMQTDRTETPTSAQRNGL
jgi:hypothetical protein